MFDIKVTRYPGGITNLVDSSIFSDMYVEDRASKIHEYLQDFDQYVAADWVNTGAGSAALTAGDGGLLLLSSAVSAFQSLQKTPAAFQNVKGFRTWGRVTAALDSLVGNILAGLLNVTVTPFTGASQTDGIYFTSAPTTGLLTGNVAVGGAIVSASMVGTNGTQVALVAGAQANLAWYYDGGCYSAAPNGRIIFDASGPGVTSRSRISIPIPASGSGSAFPGTTLVTPTLAVNAPTAVVRTLTVDLAWAFKDRTNPNAPPLF